MARPSPAARLPPPNSSSRLSSQIPRLPALAVLLLSALVLAARPASGGSVQKTVQMIGPTTAEQDLGSNAVTLSSSELEIPRESASQRLVALRFAALPLPSTAEVLSANIQFVSNAAGSSGSVAIAIQAELANNASTALLAATTDNLGARNATTASLTWTPADWAGSNAKGVAQLTPNFATVITEVIQDPAWVKNNPVTILLRAAATDPGLARRVAMSGVGNSFGPTMYITWREGSSSGDKGLTDLGSDAADWVDDNRLIAAIIGGALFLLLLIVIIIRCCCGREDDDDDDEGELEGGGNKKKGKRAAVGPPQLDMAEFDDLADWEVPMNQLMIGHVIGEGEFGTVVMGTANNIRNVPGLHQVAIKQCVGSGKMTSAQKRAFLKEAQIMKRFSEPSHSNIVRLYGVVTRHEPIMLVMEYMEKGDLNALLVASRPYTEHEPALLTVRQRLRMAMDIASGMHHLASHAFVHRDLATRNCLVSGNLTVKIGDFGLTRDVRIANGGYKKDGAMKLPMRWMAPECLVDGLFTTKSDVWAMGVVLWEIVCFGAQPYPGFDNDEVAKKVVEGYRMAKPTNCLPPMYSLMRACWKVNLDQRPAFPEICTRLETMLHSAVYEEGDYEFEGRRSSRRSNFSGVLLNPRESQQQMELPDRRSSRRSMRAMETLDRLSVGSSFFAGDMDRRTSRRSNMSYSSDHSRPNHELDELEMDDSEFALSEYALQRKVTQRERPASNYSSESGDHSLTRKVTRRSRSPSVERAQPGVLRRPTVRSETLLSPSGAEYDMASQEINEGFYASTEFSTLQPGSPVKRSASGHGSRRSSRTFFPGGSRRSTGSKPASQEELAPPPLRSALRSSGSSPRVSRGSSMHSVVTFEDENGEPIEYEVVDEGPSFATGYSKLNWDDGRQESDGEEEAGESRRRAAPQAPPLPPPPIPPPPASDPAYAAMALQGQDSRGPVRDSVRYTSVVAGPNASSNNTANARNVAPPRRRVDTGSKPVAAGPGGGQNGHIRKVKEIRKRLSEKGLMVDGLQVLQAVSPPMLPATRSSAQMELCTQRDEHGGVHRSNPLHCNSDDDEEE